MRRKHTTGQSRVDTQPIINSNSTIKDTPNSLQNLVSLNFFRKVFSKYHSDISCGGCRNYYPCFILFFQNELLPPFPENYAYTMNYVKTDKFKVTFEISEMKEWETWIEKYENLNHIQFRFLSIRRPPPKNSDILLKVNNFLNDCVKCDSVTK